MNTKTKTKVKLKERRGPRRSWRRDILASEIFIDLITSSYGDLGAPGLTREAVWRAHAVAALEAAEQFEAARAEFSKRSKR